MSDAAPNGGNQRRTAICFTNAGVSRRRVDKATKVLSQGVEPLVEAWARVLNAAAPRPLVQRLTRYITVFKKFRIC